MTQQPPVCDLLLKGGRVIDPANSLDAPMDVAVSGRKIAAVAPDIPAASARRVADVSGWLVVPGLIDTHVHGLGYSNSIFPNEMCFPYGVTTMLDVGGAGWRTFDEYDESVIRRTDVRVFALMNIVGHGMVPKYEQMVEDMDPEATARKIMERRHVVVGLKAAHFRGTGWEAIDRAVEAAELSGTFVMVDQNLRPNRTMEQMLLDHLRPGDVLTHCFAYSLPMIGPDGKVKEYYRRARERGILFDVGHGNNSFSFSMAVPAITQGFPPDTAGTDMHRVSLHSSCAFMTDVLSKLLAAGMALPDVIACATTNAARMIGWTELGTLTPGADADIAVLELAEGRFGLSDNGVSGYRVMQANRRFICQLTIRNGRVAWDYNGVTKDDWKNTPPPDYRLP